MSETIRYLSVDFDSDSAGFHVERKLDGMFTWQRIGFICPKPIYDESGELDADLSGEWELFRRTGRAEDIRTKTILADFKSYCVDNEIGFTGASCKEGV